MAGGSPTTITFPPGVTVAPGREVTRAAPQGEVEQGMMFVVTLASGAVTTVFVPYSRLQDSDYVRGLVLERVDAITAITG
jgi:hypothetical protein